MEVIKYKDIDLDKLEYSKPVNQQNVYYGPINYDTKECHIQSAKMTIKEIKEDKSSNQKWLVVEMNPSDFSFYDFMVRLDDHNLESTYKQSVSWFSKELPIDVLETMYKRITKPFKKDNIPILELKIPYQRKQYQCSFYDTNNQVISIDKLIPGSEIITIVDIKGLKFLKKNYYCDICISQIKLCYQETFPVFDKCLIVDDETQNYDYEIIDEQVIQNHKEKILLSEKIDKLSKQIDSEQSELEDLKNKLKDLK